MTTRDELYRKFGPVLLEAITRLIVTQINVLRVKAGLSSLTNEQVVNAIKNELDTLAKYDWME